MMPHTKYQSWMPYCFTQEVCFSYLGLFKTYEGALFGPKGHNMNELGRGLLRDAIYQ